MARTQSRKLSIFGPAIKSFLGHLEGTGKAAHTIRNYRLDVQDFEAFLHDANPGRTARLNLESITPAHVDAFHDHLRSEGLRSNTRRRKILTVGKFLRYIAGRNKATTELGRKYVAPHKIERIPAIVGLDPLIDAIRKLPTASVIEARNRALLWMLAETGCLVSEARKIRSDCFAPTGSGGSEPSVRIPSEPPRRLPISAGLYEAIASLSGTGSGVLFQGFNRYGPMTASGGGGAITARGIELLVRAYASRLGFPDLTPRSFRHSAAVHWFRTGKTRTQVREWLGLKTEYAFRAYAPLLETRPPEL